MSVEPTEDSTDESDSESEWEETDNPYSGERKSIENGNTAFFLANKAFRHRIRQRTENDEHTVPVELIFLQHKLNSAAIWFGIIPDTGAASILTAGKTQVEALLAQMPSLKVKHGNGSRVRFGAGDPILTTTEITVPTPIGEVTFHIVPADTPFLLCIKDMDKLCVYLDNTRNELVKRNGKSLTRIPVVRKWGHPWFFLSNEVHLTEGITYIVDPGSVGASFLTEAELRHIHKCFGHLSVEKLWKLLK